MLKKLVKYGNSNALVLDKALLELLNIQEGSVVKIRTDGVSLIITPEGVASQAVSSTVVPLETFKSGVDKQIAEHVGSAEKSKIYMEEMSKISTKYIDSIKKLDNSELRSEIEEISKRFNGNHLDPEFKKATNAANYKYAPELAQMDAEMQVVIAKYGSASDQECANFSLGMAAFKKVHEKYSNIMMEMIKLQENPEYINESVSLAEKYQATQNFPEYVKENNAMIARYIPGYEEYQAELKLAGELMK